MKKVLGYFLVALPFILVVGYAFYKSPEYFFFKVGVVIGILVVLALMMYGAYLVETDDDDYQGF